jgi:hypothetical protein
MDDDEYVYYDNERELRADYNALDRVEFFIENNRDLKDKVQRFKTFVSMVGTEMQDIPILDIKASDINFLLNVVPQLPTPGYKNPTAYILGYVLIKKGYNQKALEKYIIPTLPRLSYSVNPHDVIRYSRLLENVIPVSTKVDI